VTVNNNVTHVPQPTTDKKHSSHLTNQDQLQITLGTALAEAGVDLAVLQALMGHDHVDSSAAYIHLAPAHVRAAYDAARDRQRALQGGR
jgi:site-specific recombinase XerD